MSLAAILKRLDAIEARLNPPPPPPPPPAVDEKLIIARLNLWLSGRQRPEHVLSARLAATRERKRKPNESALTAYAHDTGYADEAELCRIAFGDGEEFYRRHAVANPPGYAHQVHPTMATAYRAACDAAKREDAFHVRRAVLLTFVEEERVHSLLDLMFP
jgi:hypothetical protein